MKILYYHQHFSTPSGATGIRSYEMAKKLIQRGHQVTMVCGSYNLGGSGLTNPYVNGVKRGCVEGINIIEFELPYSNNDSFIARTQIFIRYAWKSVGVALTEKYDLVFATTTPLTAAIPGIAAHWLRRKPFVFEVRDLWPELPKAMGVIKNPIVLGLMGMLEWAAYKSATALIGLSPGIKKGINRLGVANKDIAMIPNGCDLALFETQDVAWQPKGIADTDFLAIYSGTHGIANGLDVVINSAKELKLRGRNDIKIILIGQGKLKSALIEKTELLELDSVIFLEPVNKARLAQLMKRADVGMQILANVPAFYYGTSPNKFFDYIAAGLPVLNNYPGWLADMIIETKCGVVVSPENEVLFAEALIYLADNRQLLPEMSIAAKNLAKARFDRDKLSSEFVNWIEMWK